MNHQEKTAPLYKTVESYLLNLIQSNRHEPSYKLPSENQLTLKFKCSRITVQRALSELEEKNKIVRVQGKGSFVREQGNAQSPSGRSSAVCMVLPDVERRYSREIINGAHDFFEAHQMEMYITMSDNDAETEKQRIEAAIRRDYAGLLLFPVIHKTYHEALLRLALTQYPIVIIGHNLPGLNFSSVHCNYYRQLQKATEYLIENGHINIGYISEMSQYNTTFEERLRGYQDCIISQFGISALHSREIDFYPDPEHPLSEQAVFAAIEEYFQTHASVTAIITTNLALDFILNYIETCKPALKKLKIMVLDEPEYMGSLKGYDISIINQEPRKIGRMAAEQLYAEIQSKGTQREIITTEKIVEI